VTPSKRANLWGNLVLKNPAKMGSFGKIKLLHQKPNPKRSEQTNTPFPSLMNPPVLSRLFQEIIFIFEPLFLPIFLVTSFCSIYYPLASELLFCQIHAITQKKDVNDLHNRFLEPLG
jgi:hypothetical protein